MSEMLDDKGFLESGFQQNFDSLRLQGTAEEIVENLDEYVQENYGGRVESALLTRSGHYGISLMADSALMMEKYGFDPEAQEVADLDLCITVSDDIQEEIPEIRDLFMKENGDYGEVNKQYENVEINPRILHEGGLVGKLEKAAEGWNKPIPESVNFPDVDGTETSRPPAEFAGYFHQGYTPIKESDRVAEATEHVSDAITDENGEVYGKIWDDVWGDFESRIRFKPEVMDRNAELGKIEMAKTNAEELDYERGKVSNGSGRLKMEERDLGGTDLAQQLKDQLLEDQDVLEWFDGEMPYEVEPQEVGQQRLGVGGPEPETNPEEEIIRRKVCRFLDEHPDVEMSFREEGYRQSFGKEPLVNYFGDDFEYEMAEGAAKSALGRKLASGDSENSENRNKTELSDF